MSTFLPLFTFTFMVSFVRLYVWLTKCIGVEGIMFTLSHTQTLLGYLHVSLWVSPSVCVYACVCALCIELNHNNSKCATTNVSLAKLNELLSVLRLRHWAKEAATADEQTRRSQSYFNYEINSIELCYGSIKNTPDQTFSIPKAYNWWFIVGHQISLVQIKNLNSI